MVVRLRKIALVCNFAFILVSHLSMNVTLPNDVIIHDDDRLLVD